MDLNPKEILLLRSRIAMKFFPWKKFTSESFVVLTSGHRKAIDDVIFTGLILNKISANSKNEDPSAFIDYDGSSDCGRVFLKNIYKST